VKKFIAFLMLLALAAVVGWVVVKKYPARQPQEVANTPPVLPKPQREYRFAVLGRPGELPLRALVRMPELQDLEVRFVTCQSPAQRWLMLASGQVDAVIASSDELSLSLPRFELEVQVFPIARHQGSEQMLMAKDKTSPPLVAYLPGGVSEGLALDLKDPQLRMFPAQNPEQALAMLKSGQIRAAGLWNPWIDQAKALGLSAGVESTSFEVWVSAKGGEATGRLQPGDDLKVVRAWFDLIGQLASQPELTQRAIAEENDLPQTAIPATLRGLRFYTLAKLGEERATLATELSEQMRSKVNLWSLAGQQVVGDIKRLQVDMTWLDQLGLEEPPTTATPAPATTPSPSESATPVEEDPFAVGKPETQRQAGGNAERSGVLPGPALSHAPKQLWSAPLSSPATTSAVASSDGSQIFVGCEDGNLVCVDSASGRILWKQPLGEKVRSAPASQDSWVWAASDSGQIVGLTRADGQVAWSVQASADVVGPLCLQGDALVATTLDGTIMCLEKGTGQERWKVEAGGNITAGAAASGETVVVCSLDQRVRAYQIQDGKMLWEYSTGGACRATPCIASGLVVLGCADQKVYGLKLSDGSRAWIQKLPEEVACAAVALGSQVYLGCKDNAVHCLERGTGKPIWKYPTRERVVNDLVASGNIIYACSQDMRLYALNSDRELIFKHKENSWLETPWIENGTAYLPTQDGNLKALR